MKILSFFIFILFTPFAYSHPTGPKVDHGQAYFAHPSNHLMQVITSSDKTIINWKDFSINAHETTQFILPDGHASILNRVNSDMKSTISGTLLCNGNLILVNPNGMIVGKDAIIDTNSFIASTLDTSDFDFLNGEKFLFQEKSSTPQSILNLGTVKSRNGDIIMISRHILNSGKLQSPKGGTYLAVGQEVLLKPSDNDKVFICAQSNAQIDTEVGIHTTKESSIEAIKAHLIADGNLYKYAIKHTGKIDALKSYTQDGEVYLIAESGIVQVDGKIHVPAGSTRILGEDVALLNNGVIDTSSDYAGGEVLLGGSFQGKDPSIFNSSSTFFGPQAVIDVSAKLNGNGGKAIIWSDGTTQWYGTVNAKGGIQGGNGGFVEISGKNFLDPKGIADRSAPYGKVGTLLFDPSDITITSGMTQNLTSIGGSNPLFQIYYPSNGPPSPTPNVLHYSDLINAMITGHVEVVTSSTASGNGDITIAAPLTSKTGFMSPYTLTLTSDRDIIIIDEVQNAGSGNIVCNVGRDLHVTGKDGKSSLGSKHGDLFINTKRNVFLSGGLGQAHIGYDCPIVSGNINLNIGNDLIMQSGNNLALIGHTSTDTYPAKIFLEGNISISHLGGNIFMTSGSTSSQYCQIGHAIPYYDEKYGNDVNLKGNISIDNVLGSITLVGGSGNKDARDTGTYTLIGHGGRQTPYDDIITGNISIFSKGAISLYGSKNPDNNSKFCGIGFAQDFSGVSTHTINSNLLSVKSLSDINIRAGNAANHSFIGAYTGENKVGNTAGSIETIYIEGQSINICGYTDNDVSSNAFIGVSGKNHTLFSNIDLISKENLNIHGGSPLQGNSHAFIQNGTTGEVKIVVQNGNANIIGGATAGLAHITSSGNLSFDVQHGDLNLTTDHEPSLRQSYITSLGSSHIYSGRDINISGSGINPENSAITSHSHLTIESRRNINLLHNTLIETTNGNLKVIAGNDLHMSPTSAIHNFSEYDLSIVVDHNYPTSPQYGSGALYMEDGSKIYGEGHVRIFTAQQHLNAIQGQINGTYFTPNHLYANNAPEMWLQHFPNDLLHHSTPYTIFYKDGVYSMKTIERTQLLIDELMTDFHSGSEFLGWFIHFQTTYDTNGYEKKSLKGTSSFQLLPNYLFSLRMKKYFDQNPKTTNMILFPKKMQQKKHTNYL